MIPTTFCTIKLQSCLMNASGCNSSTTNQIKELDITPGCGAILSKSCTVNPQDGNPTPRLYFDDNVCINSMGLPNFGCDYYSKIYTKKPYIHSIYPHDPIELDKLFANDSDIIELNLSCPNAISGQHKFETYDLYLDKINQYTKDKFVGIKLAPIFNLKEYYVMSSLLLKYNIDFITCCNTVPNCLIIDYETEETMIKPNYGLGGMSFKPVSLSNVYNFHRILGDQIDIIGSGGINTGKDVFEYILCGAKCVQLGACLLREGLGCFGRISKELCEVMKEKGYGGLDDFRGCVKVRK